jgi:putative copper export protein
MGGLDMDWLQFAFQWLHVLCGVFWFGGTLYVNFVAIPALRRTPPEHAREATRQLNTQGTRVIEAVAVATIVLGFIRGTVFGPVKSLDFLFGTAYGWTWLIALVAAIATLLWGMLVLVPAVNRLLENDAAWTVTPEGKPTDAARAATAPLVRTGGLELIGFAVVFTCMILMRFGL